MTDTGICRILLVEDDPGDANLIHYTLRIPSGTRFEVVWVCSLSEALQQLRDCPPDVVLLDLTLPDSSGIETVRACRREAPSPLIVLTGHDNTGFALEVLAAGAQDYLIKGRFDNDSLVRAIRYAISRERLEQRLSETAIHLRTLINAMPDIVCFKDGEGRWLEANDFDLKLFQLENVDYRGKTDSELADYQDFYRDAFLACKTSDEAAWKSGKISRAEEVIPRPDGTSLTFDIIKVPLFHEDERRKGLVVVGRDITEKKAAEARQRLAARVFETTSEAIMVTDACADIVAVNPAFTHITGYSEAEVVGKNPRLLSSGRHDKAFHASVWQALLNTGEWSGEIWNKRKNGQIYPEWLTISTVRDGDSNVIHYTAVFSDLTEIKRAQQTAEKLAWRDPLTGLANRAMFLKQLEQTLADTHRSGGYAGILLLDIDRFKNINEARGLTIGDALLKAVAHRLQRGLSENVLIARLNSDEFAILLPRLADSREAAGRQSLNAAEQLRSELLKAFDVGGEFFYLDAGIGIALFPQSEQETASDILRHADMALQKAKYEDGCRLAFFETAMGETIMRRFRMERELHQAITENQLQLYLQPQVNTAGVQVGAEALVRWRHPERGPIPPGVFIPLAETSDLIVAVDRWMLAAVCRLLGRLDSEGRTTRISVNVSPRHFARADFVDEVKRQLATSGADPAHLVLEVTENLMISNLDNIIAKMTTLAALGIHFSMDDFGTGYSSLAYLKRLPIHELKIDKSFVQDLIHDPNDAALVEAILAVPQHLHLKVVAEGVESQEQVDFLNKHSNIIYQGYFFGKPEPAEIWLNRPYRRNQQRCHAF